MTFDEVQALLGPPNKIDWSNDGSLNWTSCRHGRLLETSRDGKVETAISDYWWD